MTATVRAATRDGAPASSVCVRPRADTTAPWWLVDLSDTPAVHFALVDPAEFSPRPAGVHIGRRLPGRWSCPGVRWSSRSAHREVCSARCEQFGVSRVLDVVTVLSETVRVAVSGVLTDPTYRRAAERMKDEIAVQPAPAHAVALLAEERRPLVGAAEA
jgi:hypothetical protein